MIMKTTFALLFCCAFFLSVHAQENIGGRPYSFDNTLPGLQPQTRILPRVDVPTLRSGNNARVQAGLPLQCGTILPVDLSLTNSGTWTLLPNRDRLWRLRIEVPEALATSLYFDNF